MTDEMKMNLQYFADPNADPNPTPDPDPNADTGKGVEDDKPITLTQKELQSKLDSEADKRVQKALDKAKADFEQKLQEQVEAAKSEGEKLAKMTAAEKAEAAQKAKEDALKKREADLNRRELAANVKDVLADKGLPADLAESLVELGDADRINETIGVLSKSIEDEVNKRVKESLRTNPPKTGSSVLSDPNDPFAKVIAQYKK